MIIKLEMSVNTDGELVIISRPSGHTHIYGHNETKKIYQTLKDYFEQ